MSNYPSTFVNDGKGGQLPMPPFISQQEMDTLANDFVVHADDLFVVTYPKCGTTWTEQIVHLILNQGEQGEQRLTDTAPWLETLHKRPGGMQAFLQNLEGRRLFTSHLPLALMPDFSTDEGKYIYVARNPKDTAVSYYHHDRSKAGYEGSWEEHLNLFMQGQVMYGSYFDNLLPWWQASQNAANIFFLKYEDMHHDLAGAVAQIAAFIDVPLDQSLLARVVAGSSFKAMSTNEKTNFNWVPQRDGLPTHFRKGEIGDWRNHFTAEQSERMDQLYSEKMRGSQLQFDFGGGLVF
ncbi:MAG: sulfotransferase domain-containing protein [Chloroflexota bacterium]